MNATSVAARDEAGTAMAVLAAVSASHFLNDMIQSLLPAVYPLLKTSYALDFGQIGLITLVFQVTASLLQPVVGTFTDRRPTWFSLPLGMGANPESVSGQLRTGDRLLLYTDGLLEARDRSHQVDELVSVIRPAVDGPLDEVPARLVEVIRASAGGVLGDDLAVLVAQYIGD